LISQGNVFGLLAVFLVISAAAVTLEKTPVGKQVSGVGLLLIGTIFAANLGIIPHSAPVYGTIWTYLVPIAIALFLLKADLLKIFREGGRVLLAFALGTMGVLGGTLLGASLLDLGPGGPEIAAVFSATYVGGSLNFVAVAEAIGFTDNSRLAAALAIDNILGVGFILAMNLLATWPALHRRYPWRSDSIYEEPDNDNVTGQTDISLKSILVSLAIATTIVAISMALADQLGIGSYSLLLVTTFSALVATLGRHRISRLRGEDLIAMLFMYMFFAIIGAGTDLKALFDTAPEYFLLVSIILAGNLLITFIAGWFLKLNYAELIVACLACIGGPPVAAALAIMMKWRNLVVPGILTGVLGYIVGNFVGIAVFRVLGGSLP